MLARIRIVVEKPAKYEAVGISRKDRKDREAFLLKSHCGDIDIEPLFHHIEGAPFALFCNAFLLASDRTSDRSLSSHLGGKYADRANLILLGASRASLSGIVVTSDPGGEIEGRSKNKRREFVVPANARVHLRWR